MPAALASFSHFNRRLRRGLATISCLRQSEGLMSRCRSLRRRYCGELKSLPSLITENCSIHMRHLALSCKLESLESFIKTRQSQGFDCRGGFRHRDDGLTPLERLCHRFPPDRRNHDDSFAGKRRQRWSYERRRPSETPSEEQLHEGSIWHESDLWKKFENDDGGE